MRKWNRRPTWPWSVRPLMRGGLLCCAAVLLFTTFWLRPAPDRLAVAGRPFFLAGVNYPWKTGQDFGNGGWGHGGVSNPTTYAEVDADFANMAATGVRVAKWRVFGDGRYSPGFDAAGFPVGLDADFFRDVDAALEIAARHDVYLVFSLFDSGFWTANCRVNGVQLGGHADVLSDPAKRLALVERALVPFLRHVAGNARVLAYEVLTEPDWGIAELHQDEDGRIKVSLPQARALVRDLVAAVRAESGALVTVEASRSRNMPAWSDLGLDYYSFSWYDWLEPWDPLDTAAASFGLDRPVVLGEFPVRSTAHDLSGVLDIAFRRGYAGAFAWSFSGIDRNGALADQASVFVNWLGRHWPAVNLFAATAPAGGAQLVPPPYKLQGVRFRRAEGGLAIEADLQVRDRQTLTVDLVATPIGKTEPAAAVKTTATPDGSGRAVVRAIMLRLEDGRPYKLSIGLFDAAGRLVKWIDGAEYVELAGGEPRTPELSALAIENPCHG